MIVCTICYQINLQILKLELRFAHINLLQLATIAACLSGLWAREEARVYTLCWIFYAISHWLLIIDIKSSLLPFTNISSQIPTISYQLSHQHFSSFYGFSLLLVLNSLQVPFFSKMTALQVVWAVGSSVGGRLVGEKGKLQVYLCFFQARKKQKYSFVAQSPHLQTMQYEQPQTPLIIGYYPVRAKAQLCRLLCQYLHIPYVDKHLNPNQWDQFKKTTAKDWIIKDMPFLIDGNFVVTGTTGCSYYVVQKSGRLDLFGRTLQDNIKITTFGNRKDLHSAVLGLICKVKANRTPEQIKQLKHYWACKIEPILQIHQKEAKENDWYLGYISLMDFIIYLVMNQLQHTLPEDLMRYKKLIALQQRVYNIPEIYAYENSARAVKCFNPVQYFNNFKQEMMKKMPNSSYALSSSKEMDLQ